MTVFDDPFDIRQLGLGPPADVVASIVVLCPGGVGRVVKAIPALRHLRSIYRGATILVVARPDAAGVFEGSPLVDKVSFRCPKEHVDLVVDFADPADRAVPRAARLPATTRVAYRLPGEPPSLSVHPAWPARMGTTARLLRLVWLLGGEQPDDQISLWPTLVDRNAAARLVAGITGPLAVVHVGARDARRRWSADGYARVIGTMNGIGMTPVLVGTEIDRRAVDEVLSSIDYGVLNLVGQTTLGQLVGILERASLFVGGDSGPGVLARVLGIHSVIVAPGDWMEQFGVAGRVEHVSAADLGDEHVVPGGLPTADSVPLEGVLAAVDMAARVACASWAAHQVPPDLNDEG